MKRRIHFLKGNTTDTSIEVANVLFSDLVNHHGTLYSILSHRDSNYISELGKTFMELCDSQLKMSSSRHLQTYGASIIINRIIDNYMRCYFAYHQDDWDRLITATESEYNSAVTEVLGLSPF